MNSCNKRLFSLIFLLFLIIMPVHAQVKHSHSIVIGLLQLRDESALGMVFSGIQLEYRYGLHWTINEHKIIYQSAIGLGIAFNRRMIGAQIHFSPVNVTWTMPFYENSGHTIRGGANFAINYNYQYYELNDGPIFWNTVIGLSPVIVCSYQWDNKRITAVLQNSLIGFTSRRQGYEPYFWSFDWRDFIINPHKNLKFGSFNNYNHTKVSFEFIPNIYLEHSFSYEFNYLGFFYGYRFDQINHNFLWGM